MQALLLTLALTAVAPAPAEAPPALYFATDRAAGTAEAPALAARLRAAVAADPGNLWLHDAWQRLASRPPLYDGRLDVEYRAFLRQGPGQPARQLLLALALIRTHERARPGETWPAEAKTLLSGIEGAPGLEPWLALARAALARSQDDRALRREVLESAWKSTGGHLALASAYAGLVGRDEVALTTFAVEIARREPRLVGRLFEGHRPPLDAGAEVPMKDVLKAMTQAMRKTPGDADLAWSLYRTATLASDRAQAETAARALGSADPDWKDPDAVELAAAGAASAAKVDPVLFQQKLTAAVASPPEQAGAAFAAIEADARALPEQTAIFYIQWAGVHARGPARDPRKAAEIYKKALDAPGIEHYLALARNGFARNAAEAGVMLDEALKVAEDSVAAATSSTRATREVSGGGDDTAAWASALSGALEARGAVLRKRNDLAGARRDFATASLVNPESGSAFARLAEVEETLGHPADALDAWIGAVARGAYEPERLAEWKTRLEASAKEQMVWATADDAVAAEKARMASAKGGSSSEPAAHPLVGQPAPEFDVARLGGGNLTLASLKGQPAIVDFWATWCGPCKMEMPALQRLHEKYADKGIRFVMLSTDDDAAWKDLVPGFVKGMGLTMTVARATDAVQSAYRVGGIPSLFLVGKDGKVRKHQLGYEAGVEDVLAKQIEAELGAP